MADTALPIPDPTTDKPPHPRHWIPISLRMFVVILVLLGVCSGLWVGVPAYRRASSLRAIELAGGTVGTSPGSAAWLRRIIGAERARSFDDVIAVSFGQT